MTKRRSLAHRRRFRRPSLKRIFFAGASRQIGAPFFISVPWTPDASTIPDFLARRPSSPADGGFSRLNLHCAYREGQMRSNSSLFCYFFWSSRYDALHLLDDHRYDALHLLDDLRNETGKPCEGLLMPNQIILRKVSRASL